MTIARGRRFSITLTAILLGSISGAWSVTDATR